MAQRAMKIAKTQGTERSNHVDRPARIAVESPASSRAIPLKIAPMLSPYRGHGRLSLRIERLPVLARLSRGRNNGDNSWSLATDELEELFYLPPDGLDERHTLSIRIVGVEDGHAASTIAVIDYPVWPAELAGDGANDSKAARSAVAAAQEARLRRLEYELEATRDTLAAREAELSSPRDNAPSPRVMEAELARARAEWVAEQDAHLAEAEAEFERRRDLWQAEQDARFGALEEKANRTLAAARERGQGEIEAALAKAEQAWKAGEAARLAAAEAKGRAQASTNQPNAAAASEALASREAELLRVREALSTSMAAVAEREQTMAQLRLEAQRERERMEQERNAALRKAEADWKAAEARRLADAEAKWRAQLSTKQASAALLAEALSARERIEAELGLVRAELLDAQSALAQSERSEGELGGELGRAREDLAKARAALAQRERSEAEVGGELVRARDRLLEAQAALVEREQTLAEAQLEAQRDRDRAQQERQAALRKAEAAWREAEAKRFVEVETKWRERSASALAEATVQLEQTEARLAEAQARAGAQHGRIEAEAASARDRAERELRRLKEEMGALKNALADREAELLQAHSAADEALKRLQQESAAELRRAEGQWKTEEALRLARAKSQWREDLERVTVESASESERAREQDMAEIAHLRDELTVSLVALDERSAELVRSRAETRQAHDDWHKRSEAALKNAEKAWKAEEAERFAQARALWREQSGGGLAEATARYQAAEQALAQYRAKAEAGLFDAEKLHSELSLLRTALAHNEAELAQARLISERRLGDLPFLETDGLHPQRLGDLIDSPDDSAEPGVNRRLIRDVLVVAVLAAVAILSFPFVEPYLPDDWRDQISAVTDSIRTDSLLHRSAEPTIVAQPLPVAPAPPPSPQLAQIVRGANLREGPSTDDDVAATVSQGTTVAVLETRGAWSRVETRPKTGKPVQGWVYASHLKDGDAP